MSRPLRPLLPHPHGPQEPDDPTNRPSQSTKKRHTVVAACEACRRRKSKCNVERPKCSACISRNTKCEYDTVSSETHSQALKRKYDELQQRNSTYEEIFEILKSKPKEEAESILHRIREGVDADGVLRHVQNADLLIQLAFSPETRHRYEFPFISEMPAALVIPGNGYLDSIIYQATVQPISTLEAPSSGATSISSNTPQSRELIHPHRGLYLKPYHVARLDDERINSARASPWTSVTSDNDLFRKLLNAYLLFEYPWFFFFHKDYFLDDLINERHGHCSALLVNAVLAAACKSYLGILNRAEMWKPQSLGYKFLAEAKRLWELETETNKLTTVQAAGIINLICNVDGVDRLGSAYLDRGISMSRELGIFKELDGMIDHESLAGRDFTAWAMFNWQAMLCYYFRKPPIIDPPNKRLPGPDEAPEWYGEIMIQYGSDGTSYPTNFGHFAKHSFEFHVILHQISNASFQGSSSGELTLEHTLEFITRMKFWFSQLPESLAQVNVITPAQLKLHMEYHYVTIKLLEAIVKGPHATTFVVDNQTAQEMLSLSLVYLETLVRLYYLRHSFEYYDSFLIQILVFLGDHALNRLSSTVIHDVANSLRSTAILCAKGLRDQSRNFYAAEVAYRLLRSMMTPEDVQLLGRFVETRGVEEEPLRKQYIQSEWPLPIHRMSEDPTRSQLGNLVREFRQVSISSESESADESPNTLN